MKTLRNHTLLYDQDCPACRIYTQYFIRRGYLDEGGRESFGLNPKLKYPQLDVERAKDEIALINHSTGHIDYGFESIRKVISVKVPKFCNVLKWKVFEYIGRRFYAFISFNRKVIPNLNSCSSSVCSPHVNWSYRTAYVLFCSITAALLLSVGFYPFLTNRLSTGYSFSLFLVLQGLTIAIPAGILVAIERSKVYDSMGHAATVNLVIGTLSYVSLKFLHLFSVNPIIQLLVVSVIMMYGSVLWMSRLRNMAAPERLAWVWLTVDLIGIIMICF